MARMVIKFEFNSRLQQCKPSESKKGDIHVKLCLKNKNVVKTANVAL